MLKWLTLFHERRLKLLEKETEQTEKLCEAQQTLNELLKEENDIQEQKASIKQ